MGRQPRLHRRGRRQVPRVHDEPCRADLSVERVRDRARRPGGVLPDGRRTHPRRQRADLRVVHPAGGAGPGHCTELRCAAADVRAQRRLHRDADARCQPARGRPACGCHRPGPGPALLVDLLPRPRSRGLRQYRGGGPAHLRGDRSARRGHRLHTHHRGYRRDHRRDRHHGRLLRGVLRAGAGRDPGGPQRPDGRRDRVEESPPDRAGQRRCLPVRRVLPLRVLRRQRPRLRVHARADDDRRPDRGVPVHQADAQRAGPQPFLRGGPCLVRARSGAARGARSHRPRPTSRCARRQGGIAMTRQSLGNRLYRGEVSVPIVQNARRWYLVSAILLAIAFGGLIGRGLQLGVEFSGGAELTAPVEQVADSTVGDVRGAVIATGIGEAADPRVTVVGDDSVRVQTGSLTPDETTAVRDAVAEAVDVAPEEITAQVIGPSWGDQITRQALLGLGMFLLAVVVFLSIAYHWKLAAAALVALFHDVVFTVGIYALVGFDVTPATVIGFLTILGYSLYDTVVIFDKVRENTKGITAQNQLTYAEAANLGVNQTLMRSINTSIIALLPIGSILFVGAGLLGAGTLKDLALALFIGVAVGTYSSVFIATPLLVDLKNREPTIAGLTRRVEARRASAKAPQGDATAEPAAVGGAPPRRPSPQRGSPVESGDRRQPQRQTRSQRRGNG